MTTQRTTTRPNVLLIMSDEQSWNTMGCTGNRAAHTPHLDALAARGVRHDGLYTPFPLCCPSRTSLMTGLMPRHHHVLGNWRGLRPDLAQQGLGRWFADSGYHTFYVGKWHVPGTDPGRMGFADSAAIPAVLDGKDRGRYIPAYRDYLTGKGYRLLPDHIENLTADDVAALRDPRSPHRGTATIAREDYLESWQSREFGQVVRAVPDDRPWFGVCSFNAPHFPLLPPAPYDAVIDRSRIELPASWEAGFADLPSEVRHSKFAQKFTDLDRGGWIDAVAHYLGLVSLVDDQVGAIVTMLRQRGELDRTVVVFTSDHGDMMGAHRLMEKGHLLHYEEAVHIPLIIAHPDGGARVDDGLHSMVDLTATLLELAGVAAPDGLDGAGFAHGAARAYVTAETLLWDKDSENAHGEHVDPARLRLDRDAINLSVRDRQHRYIFRSDGPSGEGVDELFDEARDPAETRNLAAARPDLVRGYRRLLAGEVRDVFPAVAYLLDRTAGPPRPDTD